MKKCIYCLLFLMTVGLASCGGKQTKACKYDIGVQNSSNVELSTLKVEYNENNAKNSSEWMLTDKQYGSGDMFRFSAQENNRYEGEYRVRLLDKSGLTVSDTTLILASGVEQMITYMFKYTAEKTLELETIVKPL